MRILTNELENNSAVWERVVNDLPSVHGPLGFAGRWVLFHSLYGQVRAQVVGLTVDALKETHDEGRD